MDMYLNHISPSVMTLGPGCRIGLWVQGCSINCPGCLSTDLFIRKENSRVDVCDLFKQIMLNLPGHTGLTISGGEPFEQAEPLLELLRLFHEKTSLDIMVYSGYTLDEILRGPPVYKDLLSFIDILVDGRYRSDLTTSKQWCGSDNQVVYLLSDRAFQRYRKVLDREKGNVPSLQVEIGDDNSLRIIGIPRHGEIERLKSQLAIKGIELIK